VTEAAPGCSDRNGLTPQAINPAFLSAFLDASALSKIRNALYETSGLGFHVFSGFLSQEHAAHIVEFWCNTVRAKHSHALMLSKKAFVKSCPNFVKSHTDTSDRSYFNFFWNPPPDPLTHSVAWQVQLLRNVIEERQIYSEIFPTEGRSVSYRVVITTRGEEIVPEHADWLENPGDSGRLQATLFLTEPGKDYSGEGFVFTTHQGRKLVFGVDHPIRAGDLVVWRFNNLHAIRNVRTSAGQRGFVRLILPSEKIHDTSLNLLFDVRYLLRSTIFRPGTTHFEMMRSAYRYLRR
jgi:hypothetical protein